MEFLHRATSTPATLGVFPGSYNPLTLAHLALAQCALAQLDEVVLVLPRTFPHKTYTAADFNHRAHMIRMTADRHPRLSAAASESGLFVDIAQECRAAYGTAVKLVFLCGRDAAERILSWDYPDPGTVERMLNGFDLFVAARQGPFEPPAHLCGSIRTVELPADLDAVSSSDVRRRIRDGAPWEHLVPEAIVPLVRRVYLPAE